MCIRNLQKKKWKRKNQKKAKKEKRVYMENLTGYDDIVCELALYTFNLLDQIVNFLAVYMNLM